MAFSMLRVQLGFDSKETVDDDVFHPWHNVLLNWDFLLYVWSFLFEFVWIKIVLEFFKR